MSTLHECPGGGNPSAPDGHVDWREQPYNGREVGPFQQVQLPLEAIADLHVLTIDFDLHILEPTAVLGAGSGPKRFFEKTLVHWLARHRGLAGAEVRDTGRNIHVLIPLAEPVALGGEGDRQRWDGIVRVVQAALPSDPDQPGLTALTRPVGSVNSRTGRTVRVLRPGTPTPVADVLALYDDMATRPFRTVAGIVAGADRIAPCPACKAEGSSLAVLDRTGRCYGSCGIVKLERLYDAFLAPRTPNGGEARRAEA